MKHRYKSIEGAQTLTEKLYAQAAQVRADRKLIDDVYEKYGHVAVRDLPLYILDATIYFSNTDRLTETHRKALTKFLVRDRILGRKAK